MIVFSCVFLFILVILAILLYIFETKTGKVQSANTDSSFISRKTRIQHLKIHIYVLLVEWLQSPYLFRLYADYCLFDEKHIAWLYIIGVVLPPLFMPALPILLQLFGSFQTIFLLSSLSFISLITKTSKIYHIQIISRILGVISTHNLLACIDEFYLRYGTKNKINETNSNNKLHIKYIDKFFRLSGSLASIVSGIIADLLASWLGFGYASPYIVSLIPLIYSNYIIFSHYFKDSSKLATCGIDTIDMILFDECICGSTIYHHRTLSCYYTGVKDTLSSVYQHQSTAFMSCALLQALIDSTVYVFMLSWTPMLEYSVNLSSKTSLESLPLGLIFSCLMTATFIGEILFDIISSFSVSPTKTLIVASSLISILNFLLSNYSPLHQQIHARICLISLTFLKAMYGLYSLPMYWLRKHCLPLELAHSSFRTQVFDCIIRVPVNLIIIFLIIIPLMPSELLNVNSSTPNVRFHLLNPSNLFFATAILSAISVAFAKLLHNSLSTDLKRFGQSKTPTSYLKTELYT